MEDLDRDAGGYWEFSMGGRKMYMAGPQGEPYGPADGDQARAEARKLVAERLASTNPTVGSLILGK